MTIPGWLAHTNSSLYSSEVHDYKQYNKSYEKVPKDNMNGIPDFAANLTVIPSSIIPSQGETSICAFGACLSCLDVIANCNNKCHGYLKCTQDCTAQISWKCLACVACTVMCIGIPWPGNIWACMGRPGGESP
jgi:hypothetical protein